MQGSRYKGGKMGFIILKIVGSLSLAAIIILQGINYFMGVRHKKKLFSGNILMSN